MDVGDVLEDRYEVLDLIGVGGMGRVFRAHDNVLDRTVALKVLAQELLTDELAVERILTEARLAAKVRHPNVVQVLDAIVADGAAPVIVLEFVDGPSLQQLIRQGDPVPVEEALDLLGEVAAGLAAAHDADLVHRDVSPANVLVDEGVARLTDFGIARSMGHSATMTGTIRGSVSYVAPEQATGTAIGPAADVYALGCVAVALLTGRPVFEAEEPLGIVHQHVNSPAPDIRARRPEIPVEVAIAVGAALAKDPAERTPTAAAFAASIGRPLPDSHAKDLPAATPDADPSDVLTPRSGYLVHAPRADASAGGTSISGAVDVAGVEGIGITDVAGVISSGEIRVSDEFRSGPLEEPTVAYPIDELTGPGPEDADVPVVDVPVADTPAGDDVDAEGDSAPPTPGTAAAAEAAAAAAAEAAAAAAAAAAEATAGATPAATGGAPRTTNERSASTDRDGGSDDDSSGDGAAGHGDLVGVGVGVGAPITSVPGRRRLLTSWTVGAVLVAGVTGVAIGELGGTDPAIGVDADGTAASDDPVTAVEAALLGVREELLARRTEDAVTRERGALIDTAVTAVVDHVRDGDLDAAGTALLDVRQLVVDGASAGEVTPAAEDALMLAVQTVEQALSALVTSHGDTVTPSAGDDGSG